MITRRKFILIAVVALLLVVAAIVVSAVLGNRKIDIDENNHSQAFENRVEIGGKYYNYNSKLKNILVLGIDNTDDISKKDLPGRAGQSDVVMIVSMDTETGKVEILNFSRDSMTDIDLFDIFGNKYSTIKAQIALQYAYGLGGEHSANAAKKAVTNMIDPKIKIDGYVALNFEAVTKLVDGLGGLTVTMDQDNTDVDPSYVIGATIKLNGAKALAFLRHRDCDEFDSNSKRMRRQALLMPALVDGVTNRIKNIGDFYNSIYPLVKDYIVTDLTADEMNDMASYKFASANINYAPGTTAEGEEHEEFTIDKAGLQTIVLDMFYLK